MNNFFKYGFFVLVVVVILALVFKGSSDADKLYIDTLHTQVEDLNENISRLEDQNSKIITDLASKMDSMSVLRTNIKEIESKRIAAIIYYEKRINNIDRLNVVELDSLLTSRYR